MNRAEVANALICVFGAPDDTGNLGVSALGASILQGVARARPDADLLAFDNGRGRRNIPAGAGLPAHYRDGAWNSRRWHRPESHRNMSLSSRLAWMPNRNVAAIRRAERVLDISGGDSFTDLYGPTRWETVTVPKHITLRSETPLILLPQTYGPFDDPANRRVAREIVVRSEQAWARDPDSFAVLRDLVGEDFDPNRHMLGVDVAFALTARRPDALPAVLDRWFATDRTAVGLNVSGLLMDSERARRSFGLRVDYRALVEAVALRLLRSGVERLVLVPHVLGASYEADDDACAFVAERLAEPDRVQILPPGLDAATTKWCISQLDWFCGTRMHSTIAALSSGVPSCAFAYSAKTRGVFATCGVEEDVVDARVASTDDAVDRAVESFERRAERRAVLAHRVPQTVNRARQQFAEMIGQTAAG